MQEGEPGDAMYVIKTGKLEVYVGGTLTRHVGRGCAVGELALLYHTPRSASVKVRNFRRPGSDSCHYVATARSVSTGRFRT